MENIFKGDWLYIAYGKNSYILTFETLPDLEVVLKETGYTLPTGKVAHLNELPVQEAFSTIVHCLRENPDI